MCVLTKQPSPPKIKKIKRYLPVVVETTATDTTARGISPSREAGKKSKGDDYMHLSINGLNEGDAGWEDTDQESRQVEAETTTKTCVLP